MKTAAAIATMLCAVEARRGGVDGPYLVNPCTTNATFKSAVFCDVTKGIDERAADIVTRLSITEKIDALGTATGPLPSVGLPAYNWWSEATHGISHVRDGPSSSTPEETNFALPITTGGSFNRTMWKATGHAIGVEIRDHDGASALGQKGSGQRLADTSGAAGDYCNLVLEFHLPTLCRAATPG